MPSILVATNFTDLARSAYPHAIRLARATGLPITLAHVVNYMGPQRHPIPGSWAEKATEELHENLANERAILEAEGVEVQTICRDGLPAHELIRMLDGDHAYGVMATHRHGNLRLLLPGAVASKVIRHTTKPVLIVPEDSGNPEVTEILFPVDFSELTTGAWDQALALARGYGASLHLLHVAYGGDAVITDDHLKVQRDALQEKVNAATQHGVRAVFHVEKGNHPGKVIAEVAASRGTDLIVMPAHGYHGFSRLVLGSVTEEVIRSADQPIMVIRPEYTYAEKRPA